MRLNIVWNMLHNTHKGRWRAISQKRPDVWYLLLRVICTHTDGTECVPRGDCFISVRDAKECERTMRDLKIEIEARIRACVVPHTIKEFCLSAVPHIGSQAKKRVRGEEPKILVGMDHKILLEEVYLT